jgi:murein L,D-transpeptidase YafK
LADNSPAGVFRKRANLLWRALCLACFVFVMPMPAKADNWQAALHDAGLPQRLAAVDKNRQTFLFFEKKSPLKLKYSFPCTTGQLAGDKRELNDLRTPEGVYFVDYKIASGLDFKEYGGIAYTLNYPNPVDRLRGKTGYGIWIHSKGFGIVPRNTRGCIAIGLREIDEVGPLLTPGTAVILAEKVDETKIPSDNGTAAELRKRMRLWTEAWAARSRKMFDYYDPEAYGSAMSESFEAFRKNKERLFGMLRFIKIFNREIHVLEGPDYWVTWSEQMYSAPNLSTEGVRRLYWQRGKDNVFRIVGMEWLPRNVGMRADFQKGRLVAESAPVASDASSEAPVAPRLDMPEAPAPEKMPEKLADKPESAAGRLVAISDPLVPEPAPTPPPAEVTWGARAMPQIPAESAPEPAAAAPPENARQTQAQIQEQGQAQYLESVTEPVSAMLENWRKAWEAGRLDDYMGYYTDDATQQGRYGAKSIRRKKEELWARVQPTLVRISGLRLAVNKRGLRADMSQTYADSSGHSDRGTKTLWLRLDGREWRIWREDWAPPAVRSNAEN